MEFKEQYLTYQEYLTLGGTLDEMPFNLLEYNARKKIDERTFKRLVGIGNQYEDVKLCVFNLIPTIQSYQTYVTQNKAISSENTDGYSISYRTPQTTYTETQNTELNDMIDSSLFGLIINGEHVLYSGVRC